MTNTTTVAGSAATAAAGAGARRPPIVSRALLVRFVSIVASALSFFLPLSVVPMYASRSGTAATADLAGIATGVLLLTTVACELATPRLVARLGPRRTLALGLFLLGAPALLLLTSAAAPVILAVNVLRGAGFAVTVVAGGALTAALIPTERRGEGLAVVGLVSGIPGLLALPAGVWAAQHWGFGIVFAVTAAAPLLALLTVPALPTTPPHTGRTDHIGRADQRRHGALAGLRSAALNRPAAVFAASAIAAGVLATFLPLALRHAPTWIAPTALLILSGTATVAKWIAGRLGDRRGHGRLLLPGTLLSIAGMAAIALTGTPVAVLAGAAVFGAGFGLLQNATLTVMYARADPAAYNTVSALWNAAYDLGMAAGALGVGVLASTTGYPLAFLIVALAMATALPIAHRTTKSNNTAKTPRTAPEPTDDTAPVRSAV
jgi:MFS family permease